MQLSVIIVNYNVRPFLENALTSARKALSGIDGEIIVVDNASTDGSVQMVAKSFPDVRLIANTRNTGFGAANNTAAREAKGEYLLLLNPDTLVQEDTFRVMLQFLTAHPEVGIAGCKILNPDGTLQLPCRRSFPTPWVAFTKIVGLSALFPGSSLFGKYNLTYLDPSQSYEVDAISGSFMFVRRDVFERAKGFDEEFFMYGEDLDLCYRVQQSGAKVYYVADTQIIHYKGQSARRSDIDELKLFYEAMRLFVHKHFRRGFFSDGVLPFGIAVREGVAFAAKALRPLRAAMIDFLIVDCAVLIAEMIWLGGIFRIPAYGYPIMLTVPWLIIAATLYSTGVYTTRKHSLSRVASGVLLGYIIISALVFFFKQYGFSRAVMIISGAINIVALPGWRLAVQSFSKSPEQRKQSLFGRRTLIVGTDSPGQEVLQKLRARMGDGYYVIGFIDADQQRVGEKVAGVEILGSIDNISKIVQEQRASEVIFSSNILSYAEILSVIAKTRNREVNYRLVPNSLEVIIGKTHIDELGDIPFVNIEYNLHRPMHIVTKRAFDLVISGLFLLTVYPVVYLSRPEENRRGRFTRAVLKLPRVFTGELSLVGPAVYAVSLSHNGTQKASASWGKFGVTGLVQINAHDDLMPDEIEKYNLYYAKNQSLWLDIEILLKSFLLLSR
ncbi:MAG TPA: glycosyltransferase [Bacteroidota bacterium]|nr:glycosyltransferase [Bacteroidota bacterium]